jgi:hypothetical protein
LLLLWLPDASIPAETGTSTDRRRLGLFIRRQWDRQADGQEEAARGRQFRVRQLWYRLPLPDSARTRLSPLIAALVQRARLRRLPRPVEPVAIRPGGVLLSASLSEPGGAGRAARSTLDRLQRSGLAVTAHDATTDPSGRMLASGEDGVWICHGDADTIARSVATVAPHLWARRYRIAMWTGDAPGPALLRGLPLFHEAWATGEGAATAIGRAGTVVRTVSPAVPDGPGVARIFPTGRPFRFAGQFDLRSGRGMENALEAVRGFQQAFDRTSTATSLVLSIVAAGLNPVAVKALSRAVAGWPGIALVTRALTDAETIELISGADCLLALQSSTPQCVVEAAAVGTPVLQGRHRIDAFPAGALGLESEQVDGIARTMLRIASERELWKQLSDAGLARAGGWRRAQWPLPDAHLKW